MAVATKYAIQCGECGCSKLIYLSNILLKYRSGSLNTFIIFIYLPHYFAVLHRFFYWSYGRKKLYNNDFQHIKHYSGCLKRRLEY